MTTYTPQQRIEVGRQLARILNEGDQNLIDEVALNLTHESQNKLCKAVRNYGTTEAECVAALLVETKQDIEDLTPEVMIEVMKNIKF